MYDKAKVTDQELEFEDRSLSKEIEAYESAILRHVFEAEEEPVKVLLSAYGDLIEEQAEIRYELRARYNSSTADEGISNDN